MALKYISSYSLGRHVYEGECSPSKESGCCALHEEGRYMANQPIIQR